MMTKHNKVKLFTFDKLSFKDLVVPSRKFDVMLDNKAVGTAVLKIDDNYIFGDIDIPDRFCDPEFSLTFSYDCVYLDYTVIAVEIFDQDTSVAL